MLTPEGLVRVWEIAVGEQNDSLKGGRITVSDGQQSASATIDEFPFVHVNEQGEAVLNVSATFGPDQANFAWAETRVETREGQVIDRTTESGGAKAAGQEWTVSLELALVAPGE